MLFAEASARARVGSCTPHRQAERMQSVVNFDVEVSDAVEQHIIRVEDEEDANLLDHT